MDGWTEEYRGGGRDGVIDVWMDGKKDKKKGWRKKGKKVKYKKKKEKEDSED